jgi:hypothetical protein
MTPRALIQHILHCSPAKAESVRLRLASVMDDPDSRAFIAIAWNLAHTTVPAGSRPDRDIFINEGKRQAGLFLAQCAMRASDPALYADKLEDDDVS